MYNVETLGKNKQHQCLTNVFNLFFFKKKTKKKRRSVYEDVELIPLEEFLAKAGPEYLQNSDNPHQLMINRLKYELVVRTA